MWADSNRRQSAPQPPPGRHQDKNVGRLTTLPQCLGGGDVCVRSLAKEEIGLGHSVLGRETGDSKVVVSTSSRPRRKTNGYASCRVSCFFAPWSSYLELRSGKRAAEFCCGSL